MAAVSVWVWPLWRAMAVTSDERDVRHTPGSVDVHRGRFSKFDCLSLLRNASNATSRFLTAASLLRRRFHVFTLCLYLAHATYSFSSCGVRCSCLCYRACGRRTSNNTALPVGVTWSCPFNMLAYSCELLTSIWFVVSPNILPDPFFEPARIESDIRATRTHSSTGFR